MDVPGTPGPQRIRRQRPARTRRRSAPRRRANPASPPAARSPEPRGWSLDRIEKALSVALALVGPAYVLGLLALILQVRGGYDLNLSETWYAVSLAPRMTVVGACLFVVALAVGLAALPIAVEATVAVALGLADHRPRRRAPLNRRDDGPPEEASDEPDPAPRAYPGIRRRLGEIVNPGGLAEFYRDRGDAAKGLYAGGCLLGLSTGVAFVLALIVLAQTTADVETSLSFPADFFVLLALAIGIGAARFVVVVWGDMFPGMRFYRRLLLTVACAFTGPFLVVLATFSVGPTWFPEVALVVADPGAGERVVAGRLLSHGDGYWRLLVESPPGILLVADGAVQSGEMPPAAAVASPVP